MNRLPASLTQSAAARRQGGFSLVEITVVLLVIGLIVGAVAIGRDLQRNAAYQRVSSTYVQGWMLAYDAFVAGTGHVPGDTPATPTGRVNGNGAALCNAALLNAFLAAGIALPEGRAAGQADHAVYLDSNGNPQDVQVCFQSVAWAEPGATTVAFVSRNRNVMVLTGVTPALANLVDSQIDGTPDARFGRMREAAAANAVAVLTGQPWSVDERMAFGTTAPPAGGARDEDQVAVVTGWVLMNR